MISRLLFFKYYYLYFTTSLLLLMFSCDKKTYSSLNEFCADTITFSSFAQSIRLPIIINNQTKWFLFDTGANSTISNDLQEEFKFEIVGSQIGQDLYGNEDTVRVICLPRLQLGKNIIDSVNVGVVDINKDGFRYDGIIGSDILGSCVVQVDLNNRVLIIIPSLDEKLLEDHFSTPIHFSLDQKIPFINLYYYNDSTLYIDTAIFDTGATCFLKIANRIIDKSNLSLLDTISTDTIYTLFKDIVMKSHWIHLDSFNLHQFSFKDLMVSSTTSDYSVLGTDLFSFGVVTIDFINQILYIKPYNNKNSINCNPYPIGFRIGHKHNVFVVDSVINGSLAESKGIKVGYNLKEVNNQMVSTLSAEEYFRKQWVMERNYDCTYYKFIDSLGNVIDINIVN